VWDPPGPGVSDVTLSAGSAFEALGGRRRMASDGRLGRSEQTAVERRVLDSWADGATVVGVNLHGSVKKEKEVRATPSVVDGREAQRKADITFDRQQQWQLDKADKLPPQKDTKASYHLVPPIDPTAPGAQAAFREGRFQMAVDCRRQGKGVKPRQGCSSERLNRECREDTKTGQFHEFFKIVRADVDAEVRRRHGQSELEPRRAGAPRGPDYVKVLKPLSFAIEFVDQNLHNKWASELPSSAKGPYEVVWLLRHMVHQLITSRKCLAVA
jgi:hypothetical protein